MSDSSLLVLSDLQAPVGTKVAAKTKVTVQDIDVQLPVYLINGAFPGPTLVVTAGIHGGEYPCVEAATRLGQLIDPAKFRGKMIILPSANPIAFKARSIYITPVDGLNLNREFPGDPNGTFTRAWADWLFNNVILQADMYIDMHGGDMIEALVPFVSYNITGDSQIDQTASTMADVYGIRAVLVKDDPGSLSGTTYAAAARARVPALLTEAGGQGVWRESEVDILQSGVRRVMGHFDMYEPISDPGEAAERMSGWSWLSAETDGLFYAAVQIGDTVEKGQFLGEIKTIFGETLQTSISPVSGEILFLVTSLAMNEGDPLMAIAYR